jgi:hypothetical protein
MPATFPSHAAAVLPLKLWRPRWFDGVALVVGSASPDLYYALEGITPVRPTHHLAGLFWFCLPVTLVASWLVRWAAPTVAAHLPARPTWLALPDYGVLGQVRHRWYVTIWSALLGAASHLVWDAFTHSPHTRAGWGARLVPALTMEAYPGAPWYWLAQRISTVVGALVAVAVAVYIGRRRLLRTWHGVPPTIARTPVVFWSTAAGVAALYPLTWPLLSHPYANHVQGVRMIWATALALLLASAVSGLVRRRRRLGWSAMTERPQRKE